MFLFNLNSSLTANEKQFQFAYDTNKDSYGYMIDGAFKSFSGASSLINIRSKTMTVNSGGSPFCSTELDASKYIIVGIQPTSTDYRPIHACEGGVHGFIPLSNKDASGNYEPIYVFNTDIEFTVYYIDLN